MPLNVACALVCALVYQFQIAAAVGAKLHGLGVPTESQHFVPPWYINTGPQRLLPFQALPSPALVASPLKPAGTAPLCGPELQPCCTCQVTSHHINCHIRQCIHFHCSVMDACWPADPTLSPLTARARVTTAVTDHPGWAPPTASTIQGSLAAVA